MTKSKKPDTQESTSQKSVGGAMTQIKKILDKIETDIQIAGDYDQQINKVLSVLKEKDKQEVFEAVLEKHYNKEELAPYQAELIKMQRHLEKTGKKLIILFDGRDASGKGGTIRRITRYMNEKKYRVVALGKPNAKERRELHIKRYVEHFPQAGEIVLFDRSWYNRAMVEPVMGFCTQAQYKRFMKKVVIYENNFIEDAGKTILLKLYFSVTKKEQARRFERRRNDPLRQWKLSEVDLQAHELWDEFTKKKFMLLKKTHTKKSPWFVIRSNDKHMARQATIKLILSLVRYRGRNRQLDYTPDPNIVVPGDRELEIMKTEKKKHGKILM